MMNEEIKQALSEVQEMKKMCGNINMKLTNIVTQRGQDWKKKLEAEYQRGLEDGKEVNGKGCKGCKYERQGVTIPPCNQCCNIYTNYWTAKQTDDEIKVGDEVKYKKYKNRFVVTKMQDEYIYGISKDGSWNNFRNDGSFVKTGRHFDIASILKEMQS